MGSHSRLIVSMLSALIIACLCLSTNADTSKDCGIAVYWGRKGYDNSLVELCNSGLYRYVIAAEIDLRQILCSVGLESPPLKIANISADVSHCQSKGIKVFASLTGGISANSPVGADALSTIIWKGLIEGEMNLAWPFVGSKFDGVDFAFTSGDPKYYNALAEALKQRANGALENNKTVYIAASPECAYPSALLQTAIDNGHFSFVWPNFYNDSTCDFSDGGIDGLVSSWNKWIDKHPQSSKSEFFMGLPAAEEAAKTGYVPYATLEYEIMPRIRYGDRYTGVKLWDWYYAKESNYTKYIHDSVCDYTTTLPISRVGRARKEGLKISQVV